MRPRAAALAAGVLLAASASARAQAPAGRIEAAVGAAWIGGTSMTPLTVTETQADGTPRPVFGVSRELASAPAVEARVAVRVSSRVDVEAVGSYARPQLQLTASNDVEGASAATATEQLQQFTVGGGASYFFVRRSADVRTIPFVSVDVAFARQLHQPSTLADSGTLVDAGGGVKRVLAARAGKLKAVGVRLEVRARVRPGTLSADGRTHVSPTAAASLFLRF